MKLSTRVGFTIVPFRWFIYEAPATSIGDRRAAITLLRSGRVGRQSWESLALEAPSGPERPTLPEGG